MRFYLNLLNLLGLCSIEIVGRPQKGSVSIFNHPTLFDALIAIGDQPSACCVIKETVDKSLIYGYASRLLGYITAATGSEVVRKGLEQILKGNSVIIFPEGTRVARGIGRFHRSASRLAIEAQVPVSIGLICCDPPVLNKESKLFVGPKSKVLIKLTYLPAVEAIPSDEALGIQSRQLTERIEAIFQQQLEEAP